MKLSKLKKIIRLITKNANSKKDADVGNPNVWRNIVSALVMDLLVMISVNANIA